MAQTTVVTVAPTRDATATVAKTALTTDTWATFQCPKAGKFCVLVEQTGTLSSDIIILSGTGLHKSQGNLTWNVARSSTWILGPISTSRFKSGTSINMTFNTATGAAGFSGNLAVIKLP